jgi:hypothetical protein
MFTQKYFILIFSFFLISSFDAMAQMDENEVTASEQNSAKLSAFNSFVDKFENWNVGNLHIYSKPQTVLDIEYYFEGKPLSNDDRQFLPLDLQRQMINKNQPIYAVGSIRHTGDNNFSKNEMYILRMDAKKSPGQIMLYEMKNEKLVPRRVLAYNKKVWGGYLQMETWIQDIDGDTLLDLIQKGRKVKRNGKVKKEKTKVFLLQDDGSYKEGSTNLINPADYKFEDFNK